MKRKRSDFPLGKILFLVALVAALICFGVVAAATPAESYAPELYIVNEPLPLYQTRLIRVIGPEFYVGFACVLDVADDGRTFLSTDARMMENCR